MQEIYKKTDLLTDHLTIYEYVHAMKLKRSTKKHCTLKMQIKNLQEYSKYYAVYYTLYSTLYIF